MNDPRQPADLNYGTMYSTDRAAEQLVALPRLLPTYNEVFNDPLIGNPARAELVLQDEQVLPTASNRHPPDEIVIAGYENVTFNATAIDPPDPLLASGDGDSVHRPMEDVPHMTDVMVRDAVLSHVSGNLCWGLAAAKEMTILDIIPSSAFKYELKSCTEKRTAAWCHEPYTGQLIDSSDLGPCPKPWDVLVVPPNPYQDGQTVMEVPHSAHIINCQDCSTLGRRRCWSCFGNGEITCSGCNESGLSVANTITNSCVQCNGVGRRRCTVCLGPGQLPCRTCLARGKLKLCLKLTVSWKIYQSERVVERTSIPPLLLGSVYGRVAFEEEEAAVWPINFFPDEAVNHASRELLDEHRLRYSAEKIMLQRQSVQIVPVYQIAYVWREHRDSFYIYGHDNLVYFPGYPQKSCCGLPDLCTII